MPTKVYMFALEDGFQSKWCVIEALAVLDKAEADAYCHALNEREKQRFEKIESLEEELKLLRRQRGSDPAMIDDRVPGVFVGETT